MDTMYEVIKRQTVYAKMESLKVDEKSKLSNTTGSIILWKDRYVLL